MADVLPPTEHAPFARPTESDSASLEQYILLLLSDSNLPTGGFIASSGLESYIQHGFLLADPPAATKTAGMLAFLDKSLESCAHLNLPFLTATHTVVSALRARPSRELPTAAADPGASPASSAAQPTTQPVSLDEAFRRVVAIDDEHETMVLNHVARRASAAQGMGVLTLYERAFSATGEEDGGRREVNEADALVERLRTGIRRGEIKGHFPVSFGVMTAGLGMSLAASQHLYLFLHARSLLSSAIRLNTIGPYVSHRLLLHDVRPLVDRAMRDYGGGGNKGTQRMARGERLFEDEDEEGPANTWPLGEILSGRHDQLHSKIFNS